MQDTGSRTRAQEGLIMHQFAASNPAEVYEHYIGRSIAIPFAHALLAHAAPRHGEHVLDLAAGTGGVARHIAPLVGDTGQVIALDSNADMLAVGRALPAPSGAPILWMQGNAINLGLPDQAFDLVTCQQGLQFFSDRRAGAREMHRVLRSHGRAVVSVWAPLARHPVYEALFGAASRHLGVPLSADDVAFSLGDPAELRALLSQGGFRTVDVETQTLDVSFESPDRFVQLTVVGVATSVARLAGLNAESRSALVQSVADEMASLIARHQRDGKLIFSMETNIAVARP